MDFKPSIFDYLAIHTKDAPGRPAIYYRDRVVSYGELDLMGARCRGALRGLGVKPGDRVAMVMADCPEFVATLLGIMGLGAIAVLCSTALRPADLAYILADSGSEIAVITPDQIEIVEAARAQAPGVRTVMLAGEGPRAGMVDFATALAGAQAAPVADIAADTPAFIMYTSGSTGAPKGALHRHRDIPCTIEAMGRRVYNITPDDRVFSSSRLFFAYGFGNSFSLPLGLGASVILCSERPTPEVIAALFASHKPTIFFGVPAGYRALLEYKKQHDVPAGSLRFSVSAGETLPASMWQEWKDAMGIDTLETIGTTETLHGFMSNLKDRITPGSSGVDIEGYEIRIVDNDGNVVRGEGRGDLWVKGCSVITHYWNNPEKTAASIKDGFIRTGDVYRRDASGAYFFEGRSDDLFKCAGMWVSPGEVEEALCAHPAVLEAAVVAEPNSDGTNAVAAYLSLRPGHAAGDGLAADIQDKAGAGLPRYKRPSSIHFMDQLPRTATGKVQRFKLRALSAGQRTGA